MSSENFEEKYGESTLLESTDKLSSDNEKRTLISYYNQKNKKRYCACLECRKTFVDTSGWFNSPSCEDCGGVEIRNTIDFGKDTNGKYCIKVGIPKKKSLYENRKDGNLTRTDSVLDFDMVTVYPSNRMHIDKMQQRLTYDLVDHQMQLNVFNVSDEPRLDVTYELTDAFKYSPSNRNRLNTRPIDGCDMIQRSVVKYTSVPQNIEKPVMNGRDVEKYSYMEHMNKLVLEENGIENSSQHRNLSKSTAAVDLCVRYSGLKNMVLDRVNENILYHPELSDEEKHNMRIGEVNKYMKTLATVDDKICEDIRRCKTADNVDSYLRKITFGKNADGSKAEDSPMSKIDTSKSEFEGLGISKKLKKSFNKNPVGTANFVYTAVGKIGFRDFNHLSRMMDACQNNSEDDGYSLYYSSAFANDTVSPIQTKEALRFVKTYAKTHSAGNLVKDWYEDSRNYMMFGDCASMYNDACKAGKVCATKEECDAESVIDAKRKISEMFEHDISDDEIKSRLQEHWGDKTDACFGLIKEDLEKNGAPDPNHIAFYGRDGKPIMANRTPREIHDELSALNGKVAGVLEGNRFITYSDEQKKRYNRSINGYTFELARDIFDLVRTGEQMQICVGGSNYRNAALGGHTQIVTMRDSSNQKVGCIEISDDNKIMQFKGPRNHGISDAREVSAAKEWIKETELKAECNDCVHFGDTDYMPYGDGDFTAAHLPANPYPSASLVLKYYREQERKLPSQPAVQSETENDLSFK